MVKKLDLLESNHGLRAERTIQGKAFQNGRNTTLHGPHLTRNVFPKRFGACMTSPMVSARSSIFTLRASPVWALCSQVARTLLGRQPHQFSLSLQRGLGRWAPSMPPF